MREHRTFADLDPATITDPTPFALGLYGYAGAGKTESAFRLAMGIVRVYGGEVFFADSDSRRGQTYKHVFPHRYIPFPPPHNALDYADLIEQYGQRKGVLIIDQMTEEHDGEEGLLDTIERVKDGNNRKTAQALGVAKGQHKKLVRVVRRVMATMPLIVCWRAQDKMDWSAKDENGQTQPKALGEMPIGSKDLPFEMTATYLLPPGSKGVPCLTPQSIGEKMMTKIPRWFDGIVKPGERFTEAHGEAMARWAVGSGAASRFGQLQAAIRVANAGTLEQLIPDLRKAKETKSVTPAEHAALQKAYAARRDELARPAPAAAPTVPAVATRKAPTEVRLGRIAVSEELPLEVVQAIATDFAGAASPPSAGYEDVLAAALARAGHAVDVAQVSAVVAALRAP